ncbi:MAG: hypothetical protein D6794_03010 [Deltaproteobacteria bacterium]|nr:MAG: hypothetical protein D6794_03010 [Deltaproteobacteria bacterium]
MAMIKPLRDELRKFVGVEKQCAVSLIVLLEEGFANQKKNFIRIKDALKAAREEVEKRNLERDLALKMREQFKRFEEEIDFHAGGGTFVAFIAEDDITTFQLPFTSNEKVVVDTTYEVRDLIFALNRLTAYWVLKLSLKDTRLYFGFEDKLFEDTDFFMPSYDNAFTERRKEYGSLYRSHIGGYDQEKKETETKKLYFKRIAEKVEEILEETPTIPLFVMGTEKNIGYFRNATKLGKQVAAEIPGNYEFLSTGEVGKLVWPEVQQWVAQRRRQFVKTELEEAFKEKRVATGIEEVWKAAVEQRIYILGVERGFIQPAAVSKENPYELVLGDNAPEGYEQHKDLVDDIIEAALQKKDSEVVFVNPDDLKDYGRIVAITHW